VSVSTHVLDTARGRPATGVPVTLSHRGPGGAWSVLGSGVTDVDGRVRELSEGGGLPAGAYRLDFNTEQYFEAQGTHGFYPEVSVVFTLPNFGEHVHVPLLLSPYGYATYKGT
jgi:5-hydroxyisourate hydrolase